MPTQIQLKPVKTVEIEPESAAPAPLLSSPRSCDGQYTNAFEASSCQDEKLVMQPQSPVDRPLKRA